MSVWAGVQGTFGARLQGMIGTKGRIAGLGLVVALAMPGCHRTAAAGQASGADPADVNLAPVNGSGATYTTAAARPQQVMGQRTVNEAQQQAEDYSPQQGQAPAGQYPPQQQVQGYPAGQYGQQPAYGQQPGYPQGQYGQQPGYDPGYSNPSDQAYGAYAPTPEDAEADAYAADLTAEAASEPPPPLPEYEQPPCPDPDYLWTPGYWAWGPSGYYWVPGVWVAAPYEGALWTPGYWAFLGGAYRFHHGFWGLHIGFYGGIDYGYGYTGYGYYGGYWRDRHFFYNTAVNRVNVTVVRNVYARNVMVDNRVVNGRIVNRVSYNGGRGGLAVRPRPAELAVLREQRIPPMQSQLAVRREAEGNRAQFYNQNHGRPQITAAARPVAADRSLPSPLPRTAMMQNGRDAYRGNGAQQGPNGSPDRGTPNGGGRGFAGPGVDSTRAGQPDNQGRPQYNRPQYNGQGQPAAPGNYPVQPNGRFEGRGGQGNAPAVAGPNGQAPAQPQNVQPGARQDYGNRSGQPNFRRGNAPDGQVQQQSQPQGQPQTQYQRPEYQQRQQQAQPQTQYQRPQYQPRTQQPAQPQVQQQYQQRQQQAQPQVQQRQQGPPPQRAAPPQPQQSRPAQQPHEEHSHEDRGH